MACYLRGLPPAYKNLTLTGNALYGSDFALPGYARIDAMVGRRFQTGSWHNTIQFNVLNLTDKRYYPASHPIVEDWIQVGLARTYEITLRLNR